MADIFLSYQKRDQAIAERVAGALRWHGYSVWWDQDVTPRENWDRTLEREIAAAQSVLVLWTRNSVESDWVRIEAHYARGCKPSKLVQARLDECDIPIAFSLIQFADLDAVEPNGSVEWPRLLAWLGDPAAVAQPASEPPAKRPATGEAPLAADSDTKRDAYRLDGAWRSPLWAQSLGSAWHAAMCKDWTWPLTAGVKAGGRRTRP